MLLSPFPWEKHQQMGAHVVFLALVFFYFWLGKDIYNTLFLAPQVLEIL